MNLGPEWRRDFNNEIAHAILANKNGNEGMARVCARRAAGIIIAEYFIRRGYTNLSNSAFDLISMFISSPDVDKHHAAIAQHFLVKVNLDHNLPIDTDLISDAQWLAKNLLLENTG